MDKLKFYLINTGGYISVMDYATYEIIKLLDINKPEGIKEAKRYLTELSKMNNFSYINMLMNTVHTKHANTLFKERDKEKEDWIKGAWLSVTHNTLKKLKLSINIHYNKDFSEVLEEYNKVMEIKKRESIESSKADIRTKKLLKSNKSKKDIKPNTEENKCIKKAIKPKQIEKSIPQRREEDKTPKKKIKKRLKVK